MFHEYDLHNSILRILSEKLADKKWFYSDDKLCSADFLAYFWIKQQIILEEMGVNKYQARGLKENYKNLVGFVARMNKILQPVNDSITQLKSATQDQVIDHAAMVAPVEASHIQWQPEDLLKAALERFKQREAVLLDGKIRYKREDTYAKEPSRTRYIRFGISVGILIFLWFQNKPQALSINR